MRGSSPLTRGKPPLMPSQMVDQWLIPAHAGKTRPRSRRYGTSRAHPRSRGENWLSAPLRVVQEGSSPLTRGKPPQRRSRCPARWAHPRSRGENSGLIPFNVGLGGSSPLTRGKQRGRLDADGRTGLIPAHAGKTGRVGGVENSHRAHPRSRGENGRDDFGGAAVSGSSPLTRGKRGQAICLSVMTGLIPAHAGKTVTQSTHDYDRAAHPRSRGENVTLSRSRSILTGSSPLTRGKRSRPRRRRRERGLIPAHAGKIAVAHGHLRRAAAHPRSRGENRRDRPPMESAPGSSPLTRGKSERPCPLIRAGSLIPAHAGKIRTRSR